MNLLLRYPPALFFFFSGTFNFDLVCSLFFRAFFLRFHPGWQGVSTDFCIARFAYGFGLFFILFFFFLRYGHGHRQWRLINTERSFLFYQP